MVGGVVSANLTDTLRYDDRAARTLAQEEFQRPLVLEAGAGTGKTATLVGRVLIWCLGPGWEQAARALHAKSQPATADAVAEGVLGGVVAITFTEAAATEMAERIHDALSKVAHGERPKGLLAALPAAAAERAAACVGRVELLRVQTIHSFCRSILAEWPIEAGLHPHFQIDPGDEVLSHIAQAVVRERLPQVFGDPIDPDWYQLALHDIHAPQIAEAVAWFLGEGLPAAALDADPFADFDVWQGRLLTAVRALLSAGAARFITATGRVSNAQMTARELEVLEEALISPHSPDGLAALCRQAQDVLPRLSGWSKRDIQKTEGQILASQTEPFISAAESLMRILHHISRLKPSLLGAARRVVRPLLAEAQRRLHASGFETFNALLRDTRDLLVARADVVALLQERIHQLLVDEFQDTDQLQCDIVRTLALHGARPPGLFIVGDPKQSIYGWRRADLRAYDSFVQLILEKGGALARLSVNFRSVPGVLEEVERIIGPLMHHEFGVQPEFQPLLPSEDNAQVQLTAPAVEHWIAWNWPDTGKVRSNEANRLEAQAMAADMRRRHDALGVGWGDMVLLLRASTNIETYIAALRDQGVPYRVDNERSYFRRREIIEASALVQAVLDPTDQLALLTVLRSALVGVPDAALMPLWQQKLPALLGALSRPDAAQIQALRKEIRAAAQGTCPDVPGIERVAGWERNLYALIEDFAVLRQIYDEQTVDRFVAALRQRLGVEISAAARYLGAFRVANLDHFFTTLLEIMYLHAGDRAAVLRTLRQGVREAPDFREGRPHDMGEDAVRILTIHKSKGLDFTEVYIGQLHKQGGTDQLRNAEMGLWEGQLEYVLFGIPTPNWAHVEAAQKQVESAERVRILYVALTRAKRRLVTMGRWPAVPTEPSWRRAKTLVDLVASRRPVPDLQALLQDAAATHVTAQDVDDVRWVFPALFEGESAELTLARPEVVLPTPAEVQARATALAAARAEARAVGRTPLLSLRRPSIEELRARGERLPPELVVAAVVRRILLSWNLDLAPEAELRRQKGRLERLLSSDLHGDALPTAIIEAGKLIEDFSKGNLRKRLKEQRAQLQGRAVPLVWTQESGQVVAQTIDLLFQDGDRLLLVDLETEPVWGELAMVARARGLAADWAPARLQAALGLPCPPAREVWFLYADTALSV